MIGLYEVSLNDHALPKLNAQPNNRWLTEQEIRRMEAFDGRQISDGLQGGGYEVDE